MRAWYPHTAHGDNITWSSTSTLLHALKTPATLLGTAIQPSCLRMLYMNDGQGMTLRPNLMRTLNSIADIDPDPAPEP